MDVESYTTASAIRPVMTKEDMVREKNSRGRDVGFQPSFRDGDQVKKIISEIFMEIIKVGRK